MIYGVVLSVLYFSYAFNKRTDIKVFGLDFNRSVLKHNTPFSILLERYIAITVRMHIFIYWWHQSTIVMVAYTIKAPLPVNIVFSQGNSIIGIFGANLLSTVCMLYNDHLLIALTIVWLSFLRIEDDVAGNARRCRG